MKGEAKFSESDIAALKTIQTAPKHFGWSWMLQNGATLKVEIFGRWSGDDVDNVRSLLDLIGDIIEINADDPSDLAKPEDAERDAAA